MPETFDSRLTDSFNMPELPEAEMVTRHLRTMFVGSSFERAWLLRLGLAPKNTARQFANGLRGARLEEVGRRGKHILMHFNNGRTLVVHLRMTGQFVLVEKGQELPPHSHALFLLQNGNRLVFTDQRHFGYMELTHNSNLEVLASLVDLAPEPFSSEFSSEYFRLTLAKSKQAIKLLLLDQKKVVGLGNIYASEALHRAGINPRTTASRLSAKRADRLREALIAVLLSAIESNALANHDTRDLSGSYTAGLAEESARVYGREGLPCATCQSPIKRIVQGTRSSYYCPVCQRT